MINFILTLLLSLNPTSSPEIETQAQHATEIATQESCASDWDFESLGY